MGVDMRGYRAVFFWLMSVMICAVILASASVCSAATITVNDGGDFEAAYSSASDGDTIEINGRADLNDVDVSTGYNGSPFKIEKRITIKGGTGTPRLNLRRGGIIIGKDVTFSNMALLFASKRCNAIFANGYTLTLDNVTLAKGDQNTQTGRNVHIFAGTYYDNNRYSGKWTAPTPGTAGRIVMTNGTGTNGCIYLGSMNTTWAGTASLSLNTSKQENVAIYSIGALETYVNEGDFFSSTEPDPPQIDPSLARYRTSGAVSIDLVDPHSSVVADCRTGGKNAALSIKPSIYGSSNFKVIRPASLTLVPANVASFVALDATAEFEDGVDLTVPAGCELRTSALSTLPRVAAFSGGGAIALGRAQTLTITGNVLGTTEFCVGSRNQPGSVTTGHTYITAPKSTDGAFTFTHDSYELRRDAGGNWTVADPSSPGDDARLSTLSFTQSSGTATVGEMESASGHRIPCAYTISKADTFDISWVPFVVRATLDGGKETSAAATETGGAYTAAVGYPINLKVEPIAGNDGTVASGSGVVLLTRADAAAQFKAGTYVIKYVVNKANAAASADITAQYTLTVTNDTTPPTTYSVTLTGTGSGSHGGGIYTKDSTVYIYAGTKPGYTFKGWQSVPAGLTNFDASKASTTFKMPAGAVSLTATWQQDQQTPPSPGPDVPPQPEPDPAGHNKYSPLIDRLVSDSRWSTAGTRGLLVRISVDYSFFTHVVMLDGVMLTEGADYTSYPGSTVIEIKPSALRGMADRAEHEVVAHFTDGTAVHHFTAVDTPVETAPPAQPSTGGSGSGGGGCSALGGAALMFAAWALASRRSR